MLRKFWQNLNFRNLLQIDSIGGKRRWHRAIGAHHRGQQNLKALGYGTSNGETATEISPCLPVERYSGQICGLREVRAAPI